MDNILDALKSINVICVGDGKGYLPDYSNSDTITDLLKTFNLEELTYEVVMKDCMKKN